MSNIACLDDLRNLILKQGDNEEELAEYISNHLIKSDDNTSAIKKLCDEFEAIKESFSAQ